MSRYLNFEHLLNSTTVVGNQVSTRNKGFSDPYLTQNCKNANKGIFTLSLVSIYEIEPAA